MLDPNSPLPKYQQLKEHIKNQIRKGLLQVNDQLPTENALAEQYQLSRQTVRQALSELEAEGWLSRQQGRGTFVTERALRQSRTVAVIIKSISNYIFPDIIRGIENNLSRAGYEMKLYLSQDNPELEAKHLKKVLQGDIAGVILEPANNLAPCGHLDLMMELEQKRIPYLLIHSTWPELDAPHILIDDFMGGYLATEYLLHLGHRKIAGIFNIDSRQGVDRQAGYKKALEDHGVEINPKFIGEYRYNAMHDTFPCQFTRDFMMRPDRPTAIFCYNDLDAIRSMEAIRLMGLKVPDDVSIIGYNDSILATVSEVRLTSVKHPKRDFGAETAHLIINMMENTIEKPKLLIQPELIIRSSCRNVGNNDQ